MLLAFWNELGKRGAENNNNDFVSIEIRSKSCLARSKYDRTHGKAFLQPATHHQKSYQIYLYMIRSYQILVSLIHVQWDQIGSCFGCLWLAAAANSSSSAAQQNVYSGRAYELRIRVNISVHLILIPWVISVLSTIFSLRYKALIRAQTPHHKT